MAGAKFVSRTHANSIKLTLGATYKLHDIILAYAKNHPDLAEGYVSAIEEFRGKLVESLKDTSEYREEIRKAQFDPTQDTEAAKLDENRERTPIDLDRGEMPGTPGGTSQDVFRHSKTCDFCGGSGATYAPKKRVCTVCNGIGTLRS